MKIAADTNVLARVILEDDARQTEIARAMLAESELVVLPIAVLCELVWVLGRGYRISAADIMRAITQLCDTENVSVDRPLVAAGLAMLQAGGDFADGVIAHEGRMLGAEIFVSFDSNAVKLLTAQGVKALVPD